MKLQFLNFIETSKLQILSFIPISVLEFLNTRIHQDSLLFASLSTLLLKLGYYFIIDVQLRGLVLIVLFLYIYLFNYFFDFYHLYIRERFYQVLTNCMGERALFSGERFKDHYYEEDYWNSEIIDTTREEYKKNPNNKYTFIEPIEHFGHVIFRNVLFCLVFLRLYVRTHVYLFSIVHIILVYFLLFNHFLLTTYFLSFLLISSRMVFHVTDFTNKDVQRSYKEWYFQSYKMKNNTKISMLPTWNNAILLTFHIFRYGPDNGNSPTFRIYYLKDHANGDLSTTNVMSTLYKVYNLSYTLEENLLKIKADF